MAPDAAARNGFTGTAQPVPFLADMERSFGQSFADVRTYRDGNAQAAARALQAHAYVVGDQIAFADENPSKEVVAHELAHVVQQRGGAGARVQAKSAVSSPDDAHEVEADRAASVVASGGSVDGQLSQVPSAQVSRMDVWDVVSIGTGGGGSAGRAIEDQSSQFVKDVIASINESPQYFAKELLDLFHMHPEQLISFIQVTTGLFAAEIGAGVLLAAPVPGSLAVAVILQGLLIAFAIYVAVTEGKEAIAEGTQWLDLCHEGGKVDQAAAAFARCVFHLIQAIMAVGGLAKAGMEGIGIETEPVADEGGIVAKDLAVQQEGARLRARERDTANAPTPRQTESPEPKDVKSDSGIQPRETRGEHPAPGTRSETKDQYKKRTARERAERTTSNVDQPLENPRRGAATEGHGHARHGSGTTDEQQAERVRSGRYPDDDPASPLNSRQAPARQASRFTSPEAEAEAIARGRVELDKLLSLGRVRSYPNGAGGRTYVNPSNRVPVRQSVQVSTSRPEGFGTAQMLQTDAAGNAIPDSTGGRVAVPDPTPMVHAFVLFEYVPSANEWRLVTYFPEP